MRNVSNLIEQYLKLMLQDSPEGVVEIQRNEIADQFSCVPSQINYVIGTRFTLEKGYMVESKRGGGGYIRIQRLALPTCQLIQGYIVHNVGQACDQLTAEGIIYQLEEAEIITRREGNMLRAAMDANTIALRLPVRDEVRARILNAMLIAVLK